MKITVTSVYNNISVEQVMFWADRVFLDSWFKTAEFPKEELAKMKKLFLSGELVGAETKDTDSSAYARTEFKLEFEANDSGITGRSGKEG